MGHWGMVWGLLSSRCFPVAAGAELGSGPLTAMALVEDPPQRLRWQAHLEFTHNHDVGDLTWDKIAVSLPHSEKLRSLVLAGIPHSMRPQVRCHGAPQSCGAPWPVQRPEKNGALWLLPSAVDAAVWGPAEEEELRAVLPRDREEQLQR